MEIKTFLDSCAGKWLSQKSSYHFEQEKAESIRCELTTERLSWDHPDMVSLCQSCQVEPSTTLGGMKVSWDTSTEWGQPKQAGSALLVWVPGIEGPETGQILRNTDNGSPLAGHYVLGNDEALTLTLETDTFYAEERWWFASPNLRLRTSLIKHPKGLSTTTFYSEIRKMPPKTA